MTGRDCRSHTTPPATAHSMSCGPPRARSASIARRTSSRSGARSTGPSSATMSALRTDPSPSRGMRASHGVSAPDTSVSPRPATAFTTRKAAPVTGSIVKTTPAASGATICCTITPPVSPIEARTVSTADAIASTSSPGTLRTVAYAPAPEKVAPSSSRADDLTATERQPYSCATSTAAAAIPAADPLGAASNTTPGGTGSPAVSNADRPAALPP